VLPRPKDESLWRIGLARLIDLGRVVGLLSIQSGIAVCGPPPQLLLPEHLDQKGWCVIRLPHDLLGLLI